jgi:hypothetical protein
MLRCDVADYCTVLGKEKVSVVWSGVVWRFDSSSGGNIQDAPALLRLWPRRRDAHHDLAWHSRWPWPSRRIS